MNLLRSYFPEWYKEVEVLGDPLSGISNHIDLERTRAILSDLYDNDAEKSERPNYDPVLMVNILLSREWCTLLDPHVEKGVS